MRLALATCSKIPTWEVDDASLHEALVSRGATLEHPRWDDPDIDWAEYDGVLIRTTWDYMERQDEFVKWAERVEMATALFNSAAMVRWNTHKSYLRDLEQAGVPVVPTVWLNRGSSIDLPELIRERGWTRGFIKPAIGATARETLRFDADDAGLQAATEHLARLIPLEDMLLQPYLASVETEGEYSMMFIEGELTHGVRKIPANGDYRVQDEFGATDELYQFSDEELAIAWACLEAAGDGLLYARTDFLRDEDGQLRLTEFEAVEPSMFFRHCPRAAERLAEAFLDRVRLRAESTCS